MSEAAASVEQRSEAVQEYVMHHVANSHEWHLPGLQIHLPEWLSLHGVMVLLCAFFLILIFGLLYRSKNLVPTGLSAGLEAFVLFIRDDISIACLGEEDGHKMAPLFLSFFFFIFGMNVMGLIPLFSTATANVNVTGALAAVVFFFMTFGAIYKNGVGGFFKAFVPQGIPWPVLLIVTPLEIAGLLIKSFALMMRLFANMLAGHIVIFSLLGLIYTFGAYAAPSVALALGIYLMEVFIALLQAYIFTLLSAMFIGQVYHPEH